MASSKIDFKTDQQTDFYETIHFIYWLRYLNQLNVRFPCVFQVRNQKIHQGVLATFFKSHQRISQRAVRTSIEKRLDFKRPIASRGGGGGPY